MAAALPFESWYSYGPYVCLNWFIADHRTYDRCFDVVCRSGHGLGSAFSCCCSITPTILLLLPVESRIGPKRGFGLTPGEL